MPGSDRWAKRASAAVGNGERKKAGSRATARSRRVIGSCVRRSGDRGPLDETCAPIRKLPVMLGLQSTCSRPANARPPGPPLLIGEPIRRRSAL